MLRLALFALALSFLAFGHGTEAVIDNERVVVWDTTHALPAATHNFVAVSLSQLGTAVYGHPGQIPSREGTRTIVIELKDNAPMTIPNNSGYPLAYPRPHANKLFENDRVIAWRVEWPPGQPTPMHFHDKDAVAVFEATGAIQSATPDGKKTGAPTRFGEVIFAGRNRTHAELLLSGQARAIIIELK
jgi:quercetin dioxygenase-like cupin family protein